MDNTSSNDLTSSAQRQKSLPDVRAAPSRGASFAKLTRGPSRIVAFLNVPGVDSSRILSSRSPSMSNRVSVDANHPEGRRVAASLIALTDKEEQTVSKVMIQRGLTNVRELDALKSFLNGCGESILDEEFPMILEQTGLAEKWAQAQDGNAFGLSSTDLVLVMRCIKMRRLAEQQRLTADKIVLMKKIQQKSASNATSHHNLRGRSSSPGGDDVELDDLDEDMSSGPRGATDGLLHSAREVFMAMSGDGGITVQSRDLRHAARAFRLQIDVDELCADLGAAANSSAPTADSLDDNTDCTDDDDKNQFLDDDPSPSVGTSGSKRAAKKKNRPLNFEEFEYLLNVVESNERPQAATERHQNFFATNKDGARYATAGANSNSFVKRAVRKRGAIAKISVDLSALAGKYGIADGDGDEDDSAIPDLDMPFAASVEINPSMKRTFTDLYASTSQTTQGSVSLDCLLRHEESIELNSTGNRSFGHFAADSASDNEDEMSPVTPSGIKSRGVGSTSNPLRELIGGTPSLLGSSSFALGSTLSKVAATPQPYCSPEKGDHTTGSKMMQTQNKGRSQQRSFGRLPPLPQKLNNTRLFTTTPSWAVSYTAFIHK